MASRNASSRPQPQSTRKSQIVGRRQVEALIANGHSIVIVDSKVLKVDAWIPYHPGGDKAIAHMVGRDATDEVDRFHSKETRAGMEQYQIGRVEGLWVNFLPPIQGGKFRTLEKSDLVEHDSALEVTSEQDTSSTPSSADSSPIFDPADQPSASVRRRNVGDIRMSRTSSTSSISSTGLDDSAQKPTMSVMDARTQREIDLDKSLYPSLDPATQADVVEKYRKLEKRIEAENLYQCRYSSYAIEGVRYILFFSLFVLFLSWGWYIPSAFFLGTLWHQLSFTVHDAGHAGITHNFTADTVIGMLIADYCGGLSIGWWKFNHNVHHLVTNSTEHDPDIQHMPFFAISHKFFGSLTSSYYERIMTYDAFAKFMIRYQDYLYYLILSFGRFNLYRLSWLYLLSGQGPRKGKAWWHRYFEIVGQVFFWTWYGYIVVYKTIPGGWNKLAFVMISHMITMPLHCQITLSHFAMSTADLGTTESFPQKMLRTTMDVDCPQWLDFFHGGLQYQAIHHLFPRMPRHNLRRTQELVREFCKEANIPYATYGFIDGNKVVIGKLGDVSRQAAILAECQRTIARGDH
ncbi:fatty acid/sphingolipid desaturase [Mytilinidion resinicola]|uniref:Delta 8-(E)-sphingolipid desaturase n=1 Tax=Mytilinidion resinicola TaxID=574789 RepID=A0A6A6YHQ2_9PEZI|nr:fatty acid/sphingolipid desaturase [Mytilinidion resinicola]KAF2808053.1 fatty acid/sphingolipid desaturase [Mytilinidion resinicola]